MALISDGELFDFEGYFKHMRELESVSTSSAQSIVSWINRIRTAFESAQKELGSLKEGLRNTSITKDGSDKQISEYIRKIAQVGEQINAARKSEAALTDAQKLNADVVDSLTKKLGDLYQKYQSLDPTSKDYAKNQRSILNEVRSVTRGIDAQSKSLKVAKDSMDSAEGSLNHLKKQTKDLKSQLDSLPSAYDKSTGKINEQNKAAVALNAQYQKNIDLISKVENGQKIFNRNVGNYPQPSGGGGSSLVSMAAGYLTADLAMQAASHVTELTADFQKYEVVLTNTLGSQQAAAEAMELIQKVAAKTPNSMQEMTESFVKLANRGFIPTEKELISLADLAASTGKPFDQLVEAILDAQTGEMERLKEFGITASKQGDKIAFSFKGQTTTVQATGAEIQKYILSLGELKGVAGATAGISATLTGELSNMGDAADTLIVKIGNKVSPLISLIVSGATAAIKGLTSLFKSSTELSKDSLSAYEDQKKAVSDLQKEISPLLTRYDQLTQKAKEIGGESKLSKVEQQELRKAIDKVAETIPSAISAQNEYGKVMSINTGLARDYITEQERIAQVLNADSIHKYNESLSITKKRMADLQKQLVLVQGATPTANGGPAVSSPSNQGQSSGFKIGGLSETQRVSEIARIQKELTDANEQAKNLEATIDYLSGKAPKPKSAIPVSTSNNSGIGSSAGKDKALNQAVSKAKAEADDLLAKLNNRREDGLDDEQTFIEERLKITLDGLNERQAMLEKAGKKETDDYINVLRDKQKAEADYKRAQLQLDLKTAKGDTAKQVSGLDSLHNEGGLTDLEYEDQRHAKLKAGFEREKAILTEAGQENSYQFKQIHQEQLDEQADYLKRRLVAERKAWKQQLDETKDALHQVNESVAVGLQDQLDKLDKSYTNKINKVKVDVAKNKITPVEGNNKIYALEMNHLTEVMWAYEDAYKKDRSLSDALIDDKIDKLKDYRDYAMLNASEIEEANKQIRELEKLKEHEAAEDKKRLDKEVTDNAIDQDNKETGHKLENIDKVKKKRDTLLEMSLNLANSIGEATFSILSSNNERESQALDKQHENELRLAGDNAEAKTRIDEQYAKKKAELARKAAVQERDQALFSIAIQTARGVASVLSTGGGTYYADLGISAGLLTAFVIATGALQAAAVLAKPLPQYKTGKRATDAYEGPAIAGEAGTELFVDRQGASQLLNKPTLINTKRGDTIYTATQTASLLNTWKKRRESERIEQEIGQHDQSVQNLQSSRQLETRVVMNELFLSNPAIRPMTAKEFKNAFLEAWHEAPRHETVIDQEGFKELLVTGNSRVEQRERRYRLPV